MKKILALMLLVAMAVSCAVVLSSCDEDDKGAPAGNPITSPIKDLATASPAAAISAAAKNTMSNFFGNNLGIYNVINKESSKSALTIRYEDAYNLGEGAHVEATIYANESNTLMLDANAKYEGQDLAGSVLLDKNGVVVSSESIFGTTTPYGAFFDTFIAGFENSALAGISEVDTATAKEIVAMVTELRTALTQNMTDNSAVLNLINAIGTTLGQSVSDAMVQTANGVDRCVVVNYKLTNANIAAAINQAYSAFADIIAQYDPYGEVKSSIDEAIETMNSGAIIDLNVALAISTTTGAISNITTTGTVSMIYYSTTEVFTVDAKAEFTADKLAMTVLISNDEGQNISVEFAANKVVSQSGVEYNVTLGGNQGGYRIEMFNANFRFNSDKTYEIAISSAGEAIFSVDGIYDVSADRFFFQVDYIALYGDAIDVKVAITVDKNPTLPNAPIGVKDIISLTQPEWEALIQAVKSSNIAKLFNPSAPVT